MRRAAPFLILGGIALAVRVVLVLVTGSYLASTDAGDFDRNALSLAFGGHLPVSTLTAVGGPTAFRPPAFPLLLAGVDKLVGPVPAAARWEAGRLVEAGLGAIVVLEIVLLGHRLFADRRIGWAAGMVAAIYPPLLLAGSSLLSESLFIPEALAAVLVALRARDALAGDRRRAGVAGALLCGVLVGVAALSRSNGIVVGPALGWLVWAAGSRVGGGRRLGRLVAPAALVAGVLVVLVPWTVRNAEVFGGAVVPISTETGYALAGVYNAEDQSARVPYPGFWRPPVAQMAAVERAHPRVDEAGMSTRLTAMALSYVRDHPFSVVAEGWASLRGLLGFRGAGFERFIARLLGESPGLAVVALVAFWPVALLALLGAGRLWRGRRGGARGTGAVWAVPVLLFASTLLVSGEARYRVPIDPFVLLLAAVGGLALLESAITRRRRLAAVVA